MIKFDFERVEYNKPRFHRTLRSIDFIIGFDTETYKNGKPFMFCTSDGDTFTPDQIPSALFGKKYRSSNFGVWNLKFDAGSILTGVPRKNRTELRTKNRTVHGEYTYKYIPHKMLKISKGKRAVTFWNIQTFFQSSLEYAAQKYIGAGKDDIETKTFTKKYVVKNWERIEKYCIKDAMLVSKLYDYFLIGLEQIGIKPKNLYSTASISFHYFTLNSNIVDIWRYWQVYRDAVRCACESYAGGQFEIYRRGRFEGVSYDINSAYPYEIANLLDISHAIVYRSCQFENDADYGFMRVTVHNTAGHFIPCTIKSGPINIYPAGVFTTSITLNEYRYLMELDIKVDVHDAYYLYCQNKRRPYKKIIDKLYKMKQSYKGNDKRMYMISKIMMNSFYGKMLQLVELPDKRVRAGAGFNPFYASVITANTRIKCCRIANRYPKKIYAIHTDSVLLNDTLNSAETGKRLGDWEQDNEGDGLLIACGMYQHGDKTRYRGMNVRGKFSWVDLLSRAKDPYKVEIPITVVTSWVEANFRGKDETTNIFIKKNKYQNLNCDSKRVWLQKATVKRLLNGGQKSAPHIVMGGLTMSG